MLRSDTFALFIISRYLRAAQEWSEMVLRAVETGRENDAYEYARECWRDTVAALTEVEAARG